VIQGDGDWRWNALSCTVTLAPPAGAALSDAQRAEIERGSREFLDGKLAKRGQGLTFALKTADPLAAAGAVPAMAVAKPAGPRVYVIQTGDTLADLSAAFYGSAQHWRKLAEANPGLDAGALVAGQQIVIPPRP
jgi:nucleoid-associated protein YgaU